MEKFFVANWKMNKGDDDGLALLQQMTTLHIKGKCAAIICPPYTLLGAAQQVFEHTNFYLGAQNCSGYNAGAYTGEISAHMVRMMGATAVILGHSERRQHFNETSSMVKEKACRAIEQSLLPIICVGESLDDYEKNKTLEVVRTQIEASVPSQNSPFLIAYEPVWAIGSGKIPKNDEIQEAVQYIEGLFQEPRPILYGGSVSPENIENIIKIPSISGVLVGGSSLDLEKTKAMLDAF